MTIVKSRIEMAIPKKRRGACSQHEKGLERFNDAVAAAVLRHCDLDRLKCILIGSAGFFKDLFFEYLLKQAVVHGWKAVLENKQKFLLVHANSGHKHAVAEILADPHIAPKLADTKAAAEIKALEQFYQTLSTDTDRAVYGYKAVRQAADSLAVETLLVSDNLFR